MSDTNDTFSSGTERGHRGLRILCRLIGHRYELVNLDAEAESWTDECWICGRSRTREYDQATFSLNDYDVQ